MEHAEKEQKMERLNTVLRHPLYQQYYKELREEEREEGTLVTTVYCVQKGCAFVRVHDVQKNLRAIRMTQAIMREHEV